jgi:hypothetical protein
MYSNESIQEPNNSQAIGAKRFRPGIKLNISRGKPNFKKQPSFFISEPIEMMLSAMFLKAPASELEFLF